MPEAPVDEYSHTSAAEDDISPAAHAPNGALVDAVAQSEPMEFRTQRDLRCRVPPPSGSHAACHLLRGGFRDTLANPLAPCHPTLLRLRIEGIHDHGRQRMRWYHAHRSDDGVDESRLRNDLLRADHRHNFRDETRPCLCGVGQSLLVARWPTTPVSDEYLHSMMSAL